MKQIGISQQDNFIEIRPPAFTTVNERLAQIKFLFELIFKSRHTKILIHIDQPQPTTEFHEIHTLANQIHQEDWKFRNKGRFLKIAFFIPTEKSEQYKLHLKAFQARDLNIQQFDNKATALNWLLGYTPLNHVTAYFQPIVDINDHQVVGYETLARKIIGEQLILPEQWLPELFAEDNGSQRLATHVLGLALEKLKHIAPSQYLSVNFELDDLKPELYSDLFKHYSKSDYQSRLVFEIAERGNITSDIKPMVEFIQKIQGRIALDDMGAGAARLIELVDLQPSIIKLDKKVTERLHEEGVQRFIRQFSEWGKYQNIQFLAEGIEQEEELNHCLKAGVAYGQGYLLGKPTPLTKN